MEFSRDLASKGKADLIIGNNVFAHVPNLTDFTMGLETLLKEDGTITLEFLHLLNLITAIQFDTIYHEHFSYFSLRSVMGIFRRHGLRVYDVEEIPTHGGSLRIYGCKTTSKIGNVLENLNRILEKEDKAGLTSIATYAQFQPQMHNIKNNLVKFLIEAKTNGKKVVGYGAAAKGNTLLNYAGVKPDLLPYICDMAESKQNKFTPGTHIPIHKIQRLYEDKPDYVLILPWNISDEIIDQLNEVRFWNGKFVVATPELKIF